MTHNAESDAPDSDRLCPDDGKLCSWSCPHDCIDLDVRTRALPPGQEQEQ